MNGPTKLQFRTYLESSSLCPTFAGQTGLIMRDTDQVYSRSGRFPQAFPTVAGAEASKGRRDFPDRVSKADKYSDNEHEPIFVRKMNGSDLFIPKPAGQYPFPYPDNRFIVNGETEHTHGYKL